MLKKSLFLILVTALCLAVSSTVVGAKSLTLFWAEWDPADFLQELVLDFEKETGVKVNVDSTPWGDFQTKTFQEFAAKGDAFDMVIGDSQWMGAGATAGHYVDITDWFIKHKVDKTMAPATIACYAEYPAKSKKYFAVPCEADAFGWAYRRDWFEDPKEKAAFKKKYGYELGVPETWAQLKDIAEFFYRPKEGRYGVGIWTERGYDAITMGFENVFFSWGADFGDRQTYKVEGIINSKKAVEALEFYKELYKLCPPDWVDHNTLSPLALTPKWVNTFLMPLLSFQDSLTVHEFRFRLNFSYGMALGSSAQCSGTISLHYPSEQSQGS